MIQPKVLVSVLTWNQRADTLECLASLQKMRYENFDIVVVDNGSTDGTAQAIRSAYPRVHLVENPVNLGCAEGGNCEIRFALEHGAQFLFRLGNDTIVDPDVIRELVAVASSDEKIGIVAPKVYYYNQPNRIWFARGSRFNWRRGSFKDYVQNVPDDGSWDKPADFDFYPGSFTFIRRSVLEQGVFFDPAFFIFFDDTDWYFRMKMLGWRFTYAPKAKVWHKPSSSVGMESPTFYYYRARNRLLFMKKHARPSDWAFFLPYFAAEFFWQVVWRLAREGKRPQLAASLQGVFDFCRGRFGQWNQRSRKELE